MFFKHRVVADPKYAEKTWKILEHAIHEIYNGNFSLSCEEMYRNAYNMVLHKFGEKLYSGLVTTMTYHLKEMSKSIEAARGELFLEELDQKWAEHNKALWWIRDIFMYMERTFIPSTQKTPVRELGLNLWRDVVIHASKTQSRLLDTLLELVHRERSGEVINRGLMRSIIKMLMDLGSTVYQDDFEKHFLEVSADFYRCESQEFIESCDCGNYLKKAERRLTEEMERVSHYLDARSEAKITNVVEKVMIESHMNRLVHMESSGLVNMLVDDKYDDLGRMYRLFRREQNGLVIVQDVMTPYIRDTVLIYAGKNAYNMVLHKFGEKLYSGLVTTMTYHLKEMSKSIEAARGELFLEELDQKWAEHNKALQMIRDILMYMDRTFIPSTHKTPVHELGLNLWRDVVIHASKTRSRLLDTLLELVHRERSGEVINRGLMRNIIKMLMDLGSTVYQDDFEKHFLEVSADFYRCESQEFIESCDCGNYLKKAERRLTEEMERVSHYLDARSEAKITNVVEKEMIESHMNRLVHMESSGLVNMLVDDKYDDLRRMYSLFCRVQNGLVIVRDVMTAYIRDTGKQLVTDPEMLRDPVDFVQRLLDLKDKYDKVIRLAFNNDKTFQNALNSSFEYFINLNARCPEFICLFVDDKLRKGLRGVSEEDVEVILDKVMMLVCYLQENDKEMIEGHMNRLVRMESSGLVNMLVDDKYDDLGRMYRFFRGVQNGLVIVQDVMTAYIRDTGMQLVTDPEMLRDPVDFVQHLLDLKDKYDKVISLAFDNDKTFQNALNSSFEYVINLNARSPEFICLFVDDKLRKGLRGVSEEDIEVVLDKVMLLFRYLEENDKEMIEGHMNRLVHMESSGLVNMLVDDKYDDLGRMYSLFRKVQNGLVIVRDVMTAYIRDTGKQLVTDPERLRDPVDFVQRLLDLKDKYDKVISLAFNNDKAFQNALNSSFEYFINLNARSPEFISLFVDNKLRKGLRGVSEEDVEVVLDKVMMLFRYLQEKDVFEKYYKQHLAKRLLSGKTVSDDAERSLIVKLKTECGYQFTCKLEGMFTDMKISQDTMHGFYSTVGPQLGDSPTLTVQVLTTGSWPTQPSATCNLPAEILWVCEKFKSYYLGTHNGRRLSWQTNMGTADLKSTFGKGQKHELNVSTYQLCVLMLFNNADRLMYKEIEQATEIPAFDLKRCLQSLACVRGKNVLRKEPMSKDIAEEDAFFFNDKFTSKFFNIKIGTVVAQRETEPENVETRQRVEEDRKPQIEAAIVRIMKSRRVLDHNNIVAEVTKQLQGLFLPNPVVIKRRIESLIEREFLERDKTDGKLYRYLA